jgi:hypothetical protein
MKEHRPMFAHIVTPTRPILIALAILLLIGTAPVAYAEPAQDVQRVEYLFADAEDPEYAENLYWNECSAEVIHLYGPYQIIYKWREGPNGDPHYYLSSQSNWQGVYAVGEQTGTIYRAQYTATNQSFAEVALPNQLINVQNLRFISQGSDDNMIGQSTTHFVVNANGEVTVDRVEIEIECR